MLDDMVHGFQIDYLISRNEVYQNRNVILDELSLGEKQKICLIRTFLKDSSVLLFDEPTSSLDILSKKYFIEKIKSISANKIVINDYSATFEPLVSLELCQSIRLKVPKSTDG